MTRKIFFSFHYERDAWRAGQVRNCDLIPNEDEYGFIDAVEWEQIARQGDAAIERWIREQMHGTSVTVVLIGAETSERRWVLYEITESWKRGNAVVGLTIHNMRDQNRDTDAPGRNPFAQVRLSDGRLLSEVCPVYDWITDDGRNNLGSWIESAYHARRQLGLDLVIVDSTEGSGSSSAAVVIGTRSAPFVPHAPWCPNADK
jgi:hypothetical protein